MRIKSSLIVFIVCLSFFTLSAQEDQNKEALLESIKRYYELDQENFFLHLNKTKFLPQENIWFTAYVFSSNNSQPCFSTKNLKVTLYDENGLSIVSKVVYIENGIGENFFNIKEESLKAGEYIIEATTNFAKNFDHNLSFYEKLVIVGTDNKLEKEDETAYDFQLLPEGGHAIANTSNTIGFKLINQNGKGVSFSNGLLKDSSQNIIKKFDSNQFGIGKFDFTPKAGENYAVEIDLKGKKIIKPLNFIKKTGFTISTNTLHPKNLIISLKTNDLTTSALKNQQFKVVVRQQSKLLDFEVSIPKNKNDVTILIDKHTLFPGVNTITIFDNNNKPLLERLVYKDLDDKKVDLNVNISKRESDSLIINFSLEEKIKRGSISASILPAKTISNERSSNILSKFILEPYIKGTIENAEYYFKKDQKVKRLYNLDLLLLTQGWSSYNWLESKQQVQRVYKNEVGFTLRGRINNFNEKNSKVFIKSKHTAFYDILNLDAEGNFVVDSLYLQKNDTLHISTLKNKNGKAEKPQLFVTVLPKNIKKNNLDLGKLILSFNEKLDSIETKSVRSESKELLLQNFIQNNLLDTVIIQGATETEINRKRSDAFNDYYKITDDLKDSFIFLTEFIRSKGFDVRETFNSVTIYSRRYQNLSGALPVAVIFDGVFLGSEAGSGSEILTNLRMDDIESVIINKSGSASYIYGGAGGIIEINTNILSSRYKKYIKPTAQEFEVSDGYAAPKKYYTPKYSSYYNDLFYDYGSIHWEPELKFLESDTAQIKILNTYTENMLLIIEGMTEEGKLICEKLELNLN